MGRSAQTVKTRRRLVVVGIVILAAIGFLLYKGLTSAFVYFKTANQALESRAALGDSTFQIEGTVVPCTIKHVGPAHYRFAIASGKAKVQVDDQGNPPQLFQANVAVVLVGHFVAQSDLFASSQILIKHSNQYVAAHPNRVKPGTASTACQA